MPITNSLFPALQTSRLSLTEISEVHRPDLFQLFSNPKVTQFYHVIPIIEEQDLQPVIEAFRIHYREKTGIRWGITLKGSDSIIGTIGFINLIQGHKASVIYTIMPRYWGHGYITEAGKEVIQFGFNELGLKRIDAEVIPGNYASEKVLEKLGFSFEALLRQWALWEGKHDDMKMYSLIAP